MLRERAAQTCQRHHLVELVGVVGTSSDLVLDHRIDTPDVEDPVAAGDSFGEIESVKAVSDLYSPVTGDIVAVNEKLETDPTLISSDPLGKGWLIKVKVEQGTTLKRFTARAKGRGNRISKPTCHVYVTVGN